MSYYEYRVVPAPVAAPRVKGVKGTANLFALGLEEQLNAEGLNAWEYQRSETLTVTSKQGLFRKSVTETVTVLIYRRWVETEIAQASGVVSSAEPQPNPVPRDEPETPEMLATELGAPQRTDASEDTRSRNVSLSASRRPAGDLRPVPAPARD